MTCAANRGRFRGWKGKNGLANEGPSASVGSRKKRFEWKFPATLPLRAPPKTHGHSHSHSFSRFFNLRTSLIEPFFFEDPSPYRPVPAFYISTFTSDPSILSSLPDRPSPLALGIASRPHARESAFSLRLCLVTRRLSALLVSHALLRSLAASTHHAPRLLRTGTLAAICQAPPALKQPYCVSRCQLITFFASLPPNPLHPAIRCRRR